MFKEELGRFNGPPAKIYVDKEATPRFFKARPVPCAMRGRVETELDRLLAQDIVEPVKYAECIYLSLYLSLNRMTLQADSESSVKTGAVSYSQN